MFRGRSTTSDSTDASAYSRRAAIADSAWTAQDRVRTGLRSTAGAPARAFERVAFPVQDRILWPIADRAGTMSGAGRAFSFGLVILLAVAAGIGGLVWAAPDKGAKGPVGAEVAAATAPSTVAEAAPEQPAQPTLQGAAPDFKPTRDRAAASEVDPAKAIVEPSPASSSNSESSATTAPTAAATSTAEGPAAQTASVDGPPAGPEAVSVARDFSSAFVVYETGGVDTGVRRAFGKTATPELAKALLRRPPRLPANLKVPKAKVVNVVPGPSQGDVYSVSVSLLRVGLTSELRLEMQKLKGDGWRVTNVLG
jgi:hypothetical protein